MRTILPLLVPMFALLLAACQANGAASRRSSAGPAADSAPLAGAAFEEGAAQDVRGRAADDSLASVGAWSGGGSAQGAAAPPAAERLLIQTGNVRVEVARPDEMMGAFRQQVDAWGGHLQSQQNRTLIVRVPAQRFDEAFQWVKDTGRVLSESRAAQDVTEEFLDLGIRIENARRSRDRLLEILQKAEAVEDILKVETQLRRLTEEIERMEGRRKFLADQVALATLSATFESVAEPPPVKRKRQPSRFDWINRVGAERVMEDF